MRFTSGFITFRYVFCSLKRYASDFDQLETVAHSSFIPGPFNLVRTEF